jgi:hypothetical protein
MKLSFSGAPEVAASEAPAANAAPVEPPPPAAP